MNDAPDIAIRALGLTKRYANGGREKTAVREVTPQWAVDPYTLAAVEDCAGDEDGARRVLEEARRHGLRAVEMTKLHVDLLARQGRIADAVALAFEDADLLPVADARAVVRAGIVILFFGVGFLLKFAKQTRLSGDVAMGRWTQNAAFYPYTINSVILTGTGQPANLVSSLQKPSLNGKINTTTVNLNFSSRPVKALGLRASYRTHDLTNKTDRWVISGDTSGNPDRGWANTTIAADTPYGHLTANPYDTNTKRLLAAATYDFGDLTIEGVFHNTKITRTYREATKGEDTGYQAAAIYRSSDLVSLRAKYEDISRTAEGETFYGFQADEAERDTKRASVAVILSPISTLDLSFDYGKRHVEFTNRPNRRATSAGAPEIPDTPVGLLDAKYDTYTVEVDFTPNDRAAVGAYYTYEKDRSTNQWATLTGTALNNLVNYAGSDKTDTYGANAVFQIVPEKWTLSFNAMHQKVDGLMDITAREAGSFYTPGRTTLILPGQGGAADIVDYDDTELTTVVANLDYNVATDWKISMGYWFEKYDFRDAFTQGSLLMPQSVYIFMKPDNGPYKAHVVFAKLSYVF